VIPQNKSVQFKIGDRVFCINESSYEQHLTKRREYIVSDIGTGSKEEKLRINGNSNRLVWISNLHFSKHNQPEIVRVIIDDRIDDKLSDLIDITVVFDDNTKSWCRVGTPRYITGLIESNQFYWDKNAIFINEITEDKINEVVSILDKSNQLLELLIPYE